MVTTQPTEWHVQLFRATTDDGPGWKAMMVTLPLVNAEGPSREAVLGEITRKLRDALATAEVVNVSPQVVVIQRDGTEMVTRVREKGFRHYGIFADDPEALAMFDEIESERDRQLFPS